MFRDARQLDIQRTAAAFDQALRRYEAKSESWFDGSVDSIDHRLSQCDRLLHSVRATVARLSISDADRYLRVAQELDSDRRALEALRVDLLTGASGREDVMGPFGQRSASFYDLPEGDEGPTGHFQDKPTPLHPTQFSPGMMEEIEGPGYDPEAAYQRRTQETHNAIGERYPDLAQPGQDPEDIENAQFLHPPAPDPAIAENAAHSQRLDMQRQRARVRSEQAQGQWQHAHPPAPAGGEQLSLFNAPKPKAAKLAGQDRRWVDLESARFVAANADALDDSSELATRASHHAQVKTSTLPRSRSAAITRAFVASVVDLGRRTYSPPPVKTAAVDVSVDPQMMFL